MAEVTARLHHLTGEAAFRSRPQTLLEAFGGQGQEVGGRGAQPAGRHRPAGGGCGGSCDRTSQRHGHVGTDCRGTCRARSRNLPAARAKR